MRELEWRQFSMLLICYLVVRFSPQLEMRPSSNAPSPVESREDPPNSSFPGFSEPP